jgi:hypothetical protein
MQKKNLFPLLFVKERSSYYYNGSGRSCSRTGSQCIRIKLFRIKKKLFRKLEHWKNCGTKKCLNIISGLPCMNTLIGIDKGIQDNLWQQCHDPDLSQKAALG